MKKLLLIMNPKSGKGKALKYADKLKKIFDKNGFTTDYIMTKSINNAKELASNLSDKYDTIIACGGDGTLNAVLNGAINKNTVLSFIPIGTINIFAREFNIPLNPIKAAEKIINGEIKSLDIIKSGEKYGLLMISCGIDSYIVNKVYKSKKKSGIINYILKGIKSLFKYKYPYINVKIDGINYQCKFIYAGQSKKYAGFLNFTPDANFKDGQLHICILQKGSLISHILFFLRTIFKTHNKSKNIKILKANKIEFSSPEELISQIDGEIHNNLPIEIEILPAKVKFLLPRN